MGCGASKPNQTTILAASIPEESGQRKEITSWESVKTLDDAKSYSDYLQKSAVDVVFPKFATSKELESFLSNPIFIFFARGFWDFIVLNSGRVQKVVCDALFRSVRGCLLDEGNLFMGFRWKVTESELAAIERAISFTSSDSNSPWNRCSELSLSEFESFVQDTLRNMFRMEIDRIQSSVIQN